MISGDELRFLEMTADLARLGSGYCNPNPMVGAVIVRDGKILSRGYHRAYGEFHAERDALRNAKLAGISCEGATMYVSLEPCCHYGKQPPCTEAIIENRLSRVVVGRMDPNPIVAGKGLAILREAGIVTDVLDPSHPLSTVFKYLNRAFDKFITTGKPWVLAKYAMTLDGKICTSTGDSKWVSSQESRARVHELRSEFAAILCGIGTVLSDDPMLNTRIDSKPSAHNPLRIVLDRNLRIPMECRLVCSAKEIPLVLVHGALADPLKINALNRAGVQTWCCNDLNSFLSRAGKERICSILLEGGGTLNGAFLKEGLIDEVYAFIAPKLVGGTMAKTPVEGEGISLMADAVALEDLKMEMLGPDILVRGLINKKG